MSDEPLPTLAYQSKESHRPPQPRCGHCGVEMVQGITTIERGGGIPSDGRTVWIEGDIKRSLFGILQMPRKSHRYEVISFRCPACGIVQQYTPRG